MDQLKTDCRHFRADQPCAPHKAHGVVCATCTTHYSPVATRLLLVKLAAIGDVLRTTSLLPAIHRRWPGAHVTWVTEPASLPLFRGNPLVDRVLSFTGSLPVELVSEHFDVVLSPDAAARSVAIAHAVEGEARLGFDLDPAGRVRPLGAGAERWYEMGVRDDLKRANRRTYQELIADVLGLEWKRERPTFELDDAARHKGRQLRRHHAPPAGRRIVGLNTGAGGRWRWKRWTEEGFTGLSQLLAAQGHRVFLLGGPEEKERNRSLASKSGGTIIDTGCDNDLLTFGGIVDACDAVVTGDTLAMHVAIARSKPTLVLFGPTSLHEIEVYDRGERLAPELDCLGCYLSDCEVTPKCMERLTVDGVHAALERCLALVEDAPEVKPEKPPPKKGAKRA